MIKTSPPARVFLLLAVALLAAATHLQAVPSVFNATDSATPGEVIYLQGDNFGASPQAVFYLVGATAPGQPPGAPSNLAPTSGYVALSTVTSSTQAMTVALPANIPMGLYAIWIYDGSSYSNGPTYINRARSTAFEYDQVQPGYTFRIFGRNLFLKNLPAGNSGPKVNFVNSSGTFPATVVTSYPNDGNVLQVTAPTTGLTANQVYNVTVSNGAGAGSGQDVTTSVATIKCHPTGDDPFSLGVPWGSDFDAIHGDMIYMDASTGQTPTNDPRTHVPYSQGLTTGSSGSNWVNAIQQALYDAGNTQWHPNGATVVLGQSTYVISYSGENATFYGPSIYNATTGSYTPSTGQITQNAPNMTGHWELEVPSRVVLEGAGIGNTIIEDTSPAFNGYVFFLTFADVSPYCGNLSGAQNFTYKPVMTVSAGYEPPAIRNFANNSSEMFFDHIAANYNAPASGVFNTTDVVCGDFCPQATNDSDVLVQSCNMSYMTFGNSNAYSNYYSYGSHYIFRDNVFASWFGRLELTMMNNLLFDTNICSRDANFPPQGFGGTKGCGGVEASGANDVMINNTFNAINVTSGKQVSYYNDGESILCQYSLPIAGGTINPTDHNSIADSSITATTLTDTTRNWVPNSFAGLALDLYWGPSNGLARASTTIQSNTATTLTFATPLKPVPTPSGTFTTATYDVWQANPNVPDSGTVTSATTHSITDTTKSWYVASPAGNLYNQLLLVITGGTAAGEWGTITSNSADTLNISGTWSGGTATPDNTSTYAVEQGDGYVEGTVTSATGTTLTDTAHNTPTTGWPTNFHQGDTVAIVAGPGTGQCANITGNSTDTLTFTPAWTDPPIGSTYVINGMLSNAAQHWLVKNNTFSQVPRGIIIGSGGYDNAFIGNTLQSAGGIFLYGTERNTLAGLGTSVTVPYDRMDIGWKNVITDNFVSDPYSERAPYIDIQGSISGPIYGSLMLGTDARRNILWSSEILPDPWDGAFGCDECFGNEVVGTGFSSTLNANLATVFSDNLALGSDIAYEVTSDASQTVIADSLEQNCGTAAGLTTSNNFLLRTGDTLPTGDTNPVFGDFMAPGAGTSNQTSAGDTYGGIILDANFTGPGTSTGLGNDSSNHGSGNNYVDVGAVGQLVQATGQTATLLNTSPFDSGSGSYMEIHWLGNGGAANAGLNLSSISPRYSWARVFDQRTGKWLVNGGFDFFLHPGQDYPDSNTGAQYMRAIDIGSQGTNSIRMVYYYTGNNQIMLQIITPTNGGGANITGTFTPGFQKLNANGQNNVYHLGVTFSTDASQSPPVTTAKLFAVATTGTINTASTANLIGSGTFALNHAYVYDNSPTSWFNGGAWNFGNGYGPGGVSVTNDFDGFRMYFVDPGTFPALDAAP